MLVFGLERVAVVHVVVNVVVDCLKLARCHNLARNHDQSYRVCGCMYNRLAPTTIDTNCSTI